MAAFNEIVSWKGGKISEILRTGPSPRTIDLDWQVLLMEAVRSYDEAGAARIAKVSRPKASSKRKVLVVDDSLMLLSFVEEMLRDENYQVATASTGEEGLRAVKSERPDLILLDYVLPDMKGDAVSDKLLQDPATKNIPIVYVSGFGGEHLPDRSTTPNVIGFLNKPFTSDLLIKTVETHMPKSSDQPEPTQPEMPLPDDQPTVAPQQEPLFQEAAPEAKNPDDASWWTEPGAFAPEPAAPAAMAETNFQEESLPFTPQTAATEVYENLPDDSVTGGAYFCGDTSFFHAELGAADDRKGKTDGRTSRLLAERPCRSSNPEWRDRARDHARSGTVLFGSADHAW